jgi:hypothetical protein
MYLIWLLKSIKKSVRYYKRSYDRGKKRDDEYSVVFEYKNYRVP